jgi:Uma2 family endonuclease
MEKRLYMYGDYVQWPEDVRVELIDGIVYDMSPAPNRLHQELLGALHAQVWGFLQGKSCKVYMAPFDVRLPQAGETEDRIKTVVQPDQSVICDPAKLDAKGCIGAPDLVVEIMSPGSFKHDLSRKLRLYERVGVREYWIVYPQEQIVQVYKLSESGKYDSFESYGAADAVPVGVLPELAVSLGAVFVG